MMKYSKYSGVWFHDGCPKQNRKQGLFPIVQDKFKCEKCGKLFAVCNYILRMALVEMHQNDPWLTGDGQVYAHCLNYMFKSSVL